MNRCVREIKRKKKMCVQERVCVCVCVCGIYSSPTMRECGTRSAKCTAPAGSTSLRLVTKIAQLIDNIPLGCPRCLVIKTTLYSFTGRTGAV